MDAASGGFDTPFSQAMRQRQRTGQSLALSSSPASAASLTLRQNRSSLQDGHSFLPSLTPHSNSSSGRRTVDRTPREASPASSAPATLETATTSVAKGRRDKVSNDALTRTHVLSSSSSLPAQRPLRVSSTDTLAMTAASLAVNETVSDATYAHERRYRVHDDSGVGDRDDVRMLIDDPSTTADVASSTSSRKPRTEGEHSPHLKTLSASTPPKELLAAVRELQRELTLRTDGINAIQRNFERLSAMYRRDASELARVQTELQALRDAQREERRSSDNVSGVLQAELQRLMEEHKTLQSKFETVRADKEKLCARCTDADETLKALQHEKRQLASEADVLTARLSDVEELLADTQRELADERASSNARQRQCVSRVRDFMERVFGLLGRKWDARSCTFDDQSTLGSSAGDGGAFQMDAERLRRHLMGESDHDDMHGSGAEDYFTEVLRDGVETRLRALHQQYSKQLEEQRQAHHQRQQQEECEATQLSLQAQETGDRQRLVSAEEDAFTLVRTCHTMLTSHGAAQEARILRQLEERERTWRSEEAARLAAVRNESASASDRHADEVAAVRQALAEALDRASREQKAAVDAAVAAERAAYAAELATLKHAHEEEMTTALAHHKAALDAHEARTAQHTTEMAELQRLMAQYTTQLEKQEELFTTLQHRYTSEMSDQERAAEERRVAAVQAAVAAAEGVLRDRCRRQMQCVEEEQRGRLLLWIEQHMARDAITAMTHATQLLLAREQATLAATERCSRHLAVTVSTAEAQAKRLCGLVEEESTARARLLWECEREQLGWFIPAPEAAQRVEAAVAAARATHARDVEGLRQAAEHRESSHATRISETRAELCAAEAAVATQRNLAIRLESDLLSAREALTTCQAQQGEQQKGVLSAVRRVQAAEEASESAYSCPLCFQLFEKPRSCAPCGHTFCERCLLTHPRNKNNSGALNGVGGPGATPSPLYCPECGLHHVTTLVEPRPLEVLAAKFHYRKQVLEEIIRSFQL